MGRVWIATIALFSMIQFFESSSSYATEATKCSPDDWKDPVETARQGVQELLANIPITATWESLPVETKSQLRRLADARLKVFRTQWDSVALAQKQKILLECPSAEMTAAMDDYFRRGYASVVPSDFSLKDIRNRAFAGVLVRSYLMAFAESRATLTYPSGSLPNRDWNGKTTFDSIRLPEKQTYWDGRAFAADVLGALKAIDDRTLSDTERHLKEKLLFSLRASTVGASSGDSYGGADGESACEIIRRNYDILGGYELDKGRPRIFSTDDEVITEANAVYLNNIPLKWLDVGTLASARGYCDFTGPDLVEQKIGNPTTNDVAKSMILLKKWWIERVSENIEAKNKCSIYSAEDRAKIWEAFSADQQFNNDGTASMDTYRAQLYNYRNDKIIEYRDVAKLAIQAVFPNDDILTPTQRKQLFDMLDRDAAFGALPARIATALDLVQGTKQGAAKIRWTQAISKDVIYIGGNYDEGDAVRPDDEAALREMFKEVSTWISNEYNSYHIDISDVITKIEFKVTTGSNAFTVYPGDITVGVGTARSKYEHYSTLIHELRHALAIAWKANAPDKSEAKGDQGPAVEGSGVAAEALLLKIFARQAFKDNVSYALNALDYGIRDARIVGTTDATLQKYYRDGCSSEGDENTINFVKRIAETYGLTGELADNAAIRAHSGTQYLQYVLGGLQILDDISFLQAQVDPSGRHRVDPYVLFACGLNTPRRDAEYVSALRSCMKL